MELGSIFYEIDYPEAFRYVRDKDYTIKELEKDQFGRKFQIVENKRSIQEIMDDLRFLRSEQCFEVVNRGQVWYDTLTQQQKYELSIWYKNWLDITDKYTEDIAIESIIPMKPEWLK